MRGRLVAAVLAGVLVLAGFAGGGARAGRVLADERARLTVAAHRAELAAAWPVLRLRASLRGLRVLAAADEQARGRSGRPALGAAAPGTTADDRGVVRSRPPGDVGEAPSFRAWDARPVAERWAVYRSPAWRPIRLATRAGGGLLGGALGLVALRLVGWPLLRGLWFAGALVAMRRQGGPGISHGSARWATRRELAARRPRRGRADLVVGRAGRRLVAIAEEEQYEHLLLVAPTGAGKTAGLIIPNLLAEPGTRSLVITDPKRELLRTTSPRLRQLYVDSRKESGTVLV